METVNKGRETPVNIRIPDILIEKVTQIAEHENVDKTEVYLRGIKEYVDKYGSRICQGCHTINPPEAFAVGVGCLWILMVWLNSKGFENIYKITLGF